MVKQLRLGVFLMGAGHHLASWRHPEAPKGAAEDVRFYQNIARIAEKGKLDMLFLSDGLSFTPLSHPAELVRFEPLTLEAYLSAVTTHIGFVATATTTYNEPFHIARRFASLDHLNGGRSAWNIVTSYVDDEAGNFSKTEHLSHDLRYDRAREFVEVVRGLWDSWEEGAIIEDKQTGRYFDPDKLHTLNHRGNYFSVNGPLNSSRSPQGQPVRVQAGASEAGIRFAGEVAEVVFTAQQTLEGARHFYKKVKDAAKSFGRNPDHVKIMPGISPYIGRTEAEAREKYEQLQQLILPELGIHLLSEYLGGFDLSPYPPDEPLPEDLPVSNGNLSRRQLILELGKREHLTLRELSLRLAGSRGHKIIFGTPEGIADQLEEWAEKDAADGFNIMPPYLPGALDEFVEQVVPVLQARGLFRKEYEGRTLRENLGLPEPKSRYDYQEVKD